MKFLIDECLHVFGGGRALRRTRLIDVGVQVVCGNIPGPEWDERLQGNRRHSYTEHPGATPPCYQRNFRLICPMRPGRALVTRPKLPLVKLPVGLLNWACSKALKYSARNCTDMLSRILVIFCSP